MDILHIHRRQVKSDSSNLLWTASYMCMTFCWKTFRAAKLYMNVKGEKYKI